MQLLTLSQAAPPVQRPTLIQPWRSIGLRTLYPLKLRYYTHYHQFAYSSRCERNGSSR